MRETSNRAGHDRPAAPRLAKGRRNLFFLLNVLAALCLVPMTASAKTPGSTYCFYKTCHRVKTINETRALIGKSIKLNASHYNDCRKDRYNPCGLTSSGEAFRPNKPDNAASPIYPDGTILLVRNPVTRDSAIIRINNAGPYWGNRKLDVSIATARRLGFARRGVAKLETKILAAPSKRDAKYRRNRRYKRVAGYIGKHISLRSAFETSTAIMAVEALAGSMHAPAAASIVAAANHEPDSAETLRAKMQAKTRRIQNTIKNAETLPAQRLKPVKKPDYELHPVRIAGYVKNKGRKNRSRDSVGSGRYVSNAPTNRVPPILRAPKKNVEPKTAIVQTTELQKAKATLHMVASKNIARFNLDVGANNLFVSHGKAHQIRRSNLRQAFISANPWPTPKRARPTPPRVLTLGHLGVLKTSTSPAIL